MKLISSGVLYFGLTYLAGFACGALRETFAVPKFGQFVSVLIELPVMMAATYVAAYFVIGRIAPRPSAADRLVIGITGFALLMVAEVIFAGLLRGWSLAQWQGHLKTAEGALSLVLFGLFAAMPLLVRRV